MTNDHVLLPLAISLLVWASASWALPQPRGEARENTEEEESSGRFIGVTKGGKWFGAVQIEVPLTVVLPTLGYRTRYSRGSFSGRNHGAIDLNLLEPDYDPNDPEYHLDFYYGPLLSRLDAYFHYLGVHDEKCRQKLVCQLSKHPNKYSPLSDVVIKALKESESYARPQFHSSAVFRFYTYYWSSRRHDSCKAAFPECPADISDMVNLTSLQLWQDISDLLAIKLVDE